jgi:hypothetical protein
MKVGVIKYIHRKHKGWEFRAAIARVEDGGKEKDVVFGVSNESGAGLEIYQGENYIVGSKERSRSWRYGEGSIPKKWEKLYLILEAMHGTIDWSRDVSKITSGLVNKYM